MNSEHMKLLIDLIDHGSFTKTQEHSFLSKQAMYKQVKKLEDETGCILLERTRTGVRPTEAGKIFYDGAKQLLKEEADLISACRKATMSETIRIGNVEHQVILDPVTDMYSTVYPEINITRVVHPNHSGEYRVQENIMDVGETFRLSDMKQMNTGYTPLVKTKFHIAVRRNHPLSEKRLLTLSELSSFHMYIFPMMLEKQQVKELKQAYSLHPSLLHERMDVDHQVDIAFSCLNNDYLFLTANPFIRKIHELAVIPLDTSWRREYGIIYQEPVSESIQAYIDTAVQVYKTPEDPFFEPLAEPVSFIPKK
ncbi:MAG: LysR family transcriptional regulator [Solobacterium sp.]|nr:LysR family transcriptional regulator [Solobacterium sp.]